MRKFLSMVLAILLTFGALNVFANDTEKYIAELNKYEIVKGDPDGNMRLADNLTRAEAVTLMVRLYGFTPETSAAAPANTFTDMEEHWACNAAMLAKGLKIVDTMDGEAFNPDEEITAQEFLKMAVCLLGYREEAENKAPDYIGYILQASQSGITKDVPLITDKPITRGQAVKIIINSLDVPLMVQTSYGKDNKYTIMDGKDGNEYRTLRTAIESE